MIPCSRSARNPDRFRLRGQMFLSVNDRRNTVNTVTVNAGDGRGDRLRVTWDRR